MVAACKDLKDTVAVYAFSARASSILPAGMKELQPVDFLLVNAKKWALAAGMTVSLT